MAYGDRSIEDALPLYHFSNSEPSAPESLVEAISTLVYSLGAMTHKLDKVLDLNLPNSSRLPSANWAKPDKAESSSQPTTEPPISTTIYKQSRRLQTEAFISHVIDLMIAHNNQATHHADKWFISYSLLDKRKVCSSKKALRSVFALRQTEIDAHHQQHQITRSHNRIYHQDSQLSDFFDF